MPPNSIDQIFWDASQLASAAERDAYLDRVCGGDAEMRRKVELLLEARSKAESFLETPAVRLGDELAAIPDADDTRTSPATNGDEGLDFLEPSDKSGSIGRLGHYEVREVVGRGGMGVVLRAFDETLHRVVAIKVMATQLATSATARRRFTREARAAAAVTHDHVVTIHAVEEAGPLPYIVMQFVAGASLQERLDLTGPLPLLEILRIGMQTASGLAAAHAQGLVHRDVKPANILLENGVERVKLTDFGLARAADDASLTQSGVVAGTPSFMSPEQAEGKPVDHRSDLFSLGSVLYAMCTGRPPFRAGTNMGVLKRVCEETPTPVRETNPEVPDWLVAVVEKLHAKDPAARFQSAVEVAELLGRHLTQVQHPSVVPPSAVAKPANEPPAPERPVRRKRWAAAAAVLVAALAVLGTTEATGVTNVRATVARLFTPDGTLVVETDGPDVSVTVEEDGVVVVSGSRLREIRLKPGSYRVWADRDGKRLPLDRELVTVSGRGREIVRVKLEPAPPAPVVKVEKGAFVLLAEGKERKFDTLAEAVSASADGDTIEVRGNGPFVCDRIMISNRRALTIRAGAGIRPVLRLGRGTVEDQTCLLTTNGPLVLEGLEIVCERGPTVNTAAFFAAVVASESRLHVANCRFVAPFRQSLYVPDCRRAVVTNCEFLGSATECSALAGHQAPGGVWELDNCVQIGGAAVSCGSVSRDVREGTVRIRRCSLVGCQPLFCYFFAIPKDPESGRAAGMVRVEVSGCLLDVGQLTGAIWYPESMNQSHTPPAVKPEDALRHVTSWRGSDIVYHRLGNSPAGPKGALIHLRAGEQDEWLPGVTDLATWQKFWGSPETGSVTGEVRYGGGDLAARWPKEADKLTPDDFRLRSDSAGYRAGKDKKDLGADVDLVGPGLAYERWKKTPEYQQWLKETGQVRAEAPKPEPGAFVVIGGKGIAERKFDTLAAAVLGSADGDTIEVRGNGPFVSEPVTTTQRLIIRAAAGFRPVLRFESKDELPGLQAGAPLVLEGLELQVLNKKEVGVVPSDHPVYLANCRLVLAGNGACVTTSPVTVVRNCELMGNFGMSIKCVTRGRLTVENSVQVGTHTLFLNCADDEVRDFSIELRRNTLVDSGGAILFATPKRLPPGADAPAKMVDVEAVGNVIVSRAALVSVWEETKTTLKRALGWRERDNVYDVGEFVAWEKGLVDWNKYWALSDTGTQSATVRFAGGDLHSKRALQPGGLTPRDFRLREDSAGYQAGKDKKDLGADVDLVGPGASYERWKKTPEYQQWLKETEQLEK